MLCLSLVSSAGCSGASARCGCPQGLGNAVNSPWVLAARSEAGSPLLRKCVMRSLKYLKMLGFSSGQLSRELWDSLKLLVAGCFPRCKFPPH